MQKRIELLEEIIKIQNYRISHYESGNIKGHEEYRNKIKHIEQQLASLPKEQSVTDEEIIEAPDL